MDIYISTHRERDTPPHTQTDPQKDAFNTSPMGARSGSEGPHQGLEVILSVYIGTYTHTGPHIRVSQGVSLRVHREYQTQDLEPGQEVAVPTSPYHRT